jgi:hypothetical protein
MRKFEEIDGQTVPRLGIESNPDEAELWTLVDLIAPENYLDRVGQIVSWNDAILPYRSRPRYSSAS